MTPPSFRFLVASHVAALGVGYVAAPKQPVDTEAKLTGFFQVDTSHVLTATVASLREEAQLKVFSAKVGAEVEMNRTRFYLFGLHQRLTVPAAVSYYLDLSQLTLADVIFDERAKLVRVQLPKITVGDIAFQPENATTVNGGLLSYSEEQVEEVRKANYTQAGRVVVAQAQQSGLINAAKRQAITDVEQYFSIPLRIAGQPYVKVIATFK